MRKTTAPGVQGTPDGSRQWSKPGSWLLEFHQGTVFRIQHDDFEGLDPKQIQGSKKQTNDWLVVLVDFIGS